MGINIEEIKKKVRLASDLYDMAFEIKITALKRKYPEKSKAEIKEIAMKLFHSNKVTS